jgi:hypothetical protein
LQKIDKLKASLHLTDMTPATSSIALPTNKHTIFVDSPRDVRQFDAAKYLKCSPALLGRKSNRLRIEQMHSTSVLGVHAPEDIIVSSCFVFIFMFCRTLIVNDEKCTNNWRYALTV